MVGRVSSPQFVGRHEELAALEPALGQAREGVGSVVLVAAEAGMGKSRLIAELGDRARLAGMMVLGGECLPFGEGELPYAPVLGALRSLVRQWDVTELESLVGPARAELRALMPELSDGSEDTSRPHRHDGSQGRLFEQLVGLLGSAARVVPLVLVVEDFQWADRSTRDFLTFLVRAARHEPIALIVSYRSDELRRRHPMRPFVLELERTGRAIRVELRPFSRAELRQQVAGILGETPPRLLVDRLLERSEGNPFFIEELLASSGQPGEPLPESLRDTLLTRVERQPAGVREVLRITAVAGRTIDHEVLAAASDLSEMELTGALRIAVESYLLTHDSSTAGYSFRHALLREAIYSDLLPGERRSLHLRLARTLSEHPDLADAPASSAAERAHHWYAAGELPEALTASIDAGVAAEQLYALGEAWLHYERALELWDRSSRAAAEAPLGRLEVLRRAADAASLTGEPERAIALAREVLARAGEHAATVEAALAYERLGRYLWTAGRDKDALPAYRRAVELMPEVPPSEARALVLAAEGQMLMLCNRTAESTARCEEALAIARAIRAEAVEAHVLNTMCGNLSAFGKFYQAVMVARRALAIGRRMRLAEEMNRSYMNGSDALDQVGSIDESIAMAWEGIEAAREAGFERQWGDLLCGEVAGRLLQIGRWNEAEQLLKEVVDRCPSGVTAAMAYRNLGYLLSERGDFDAAARALDQAEDQIRRSVGSMTLGPPAAARASLELWTGHSEAAWATVSDCLERVGEGEYIFFTARLYELGMRACAELAARAPGDARTGQRQSAAAQKLLERLDGLIAGTPGLIPPLVRASRAAAAAECSRIADTGDASLWADARRQWHICGNEYHAAYARWREAEAILAAAGSRSEAEALAREAYAAAGSLGARPLLEGLDALARRARIDLSQRRASEAAPNPALERLELTARELEVLALLTRGLTNREIGAELFISEKTASVHVSRILNKLSVPNRAAAAAVAQRLAGMAH